ncbi:MAG: serine/threonine protein kinase [Deltaproteobacteria bacterium]|nr:serine/threonine protein kinase [Deltaproteobacteria bacterium]
MEAIAKGTVVGQSYRLLQLLGRGGMGEVWMAQHLRLPRRVAVKFLLASANDRPELLARFKRETQVTSQLGHPNIVEVLDTNTMSDGRPYYVMELLEGENLRHRLRDGKIPQDRTLELLRQIASGLHAAHRAGVVHRDLKPENIFLARVTTDFGAEGEVAKIVDFGISKLQRPQDFVTCDNRVLGTAPYAC